MEIDKMKDNSKAFLSIKNVEKIYPNGEKAVYNFNLDIYKNEFVVVVGPSGCGKSTMLRMITGLEDISSGMLYMEDELINYKPSKDRKMAIVFQSYALYPQMNVYENIAFPLTINEYPLPLVNQALHACAQIKRLVKENGIRLVADKVNEAAKIKGKTSKRYEFIADSLSVEYYTAEKLYDLLECFSGSDEKVIKNELEQRLDSAAVREAEQLKNKGIRVDGEGYVLDENGDVLTETRKMTPYEIRRTVYEKAKILDLIPYLDKLPKELSGGQMQRVALGRAIVKNVPIFLMDEPLSNLDAKLRLTMRSEIVKLHNSINATTIYVTHDQTEAMTMASKIVVMSKGFVQQIGSPEHIYNSPDNIFVARFIGSPAMNIFDLEFDRQKKCLHTEGLAIDLDVGALVKHDEFYTQELDKFKEVVQNFDESAYEYVLKILSSTDEVFDNKQKIHKKQNMLKSISKLFEKSEVTSTRAKELKIAQEKKEQLEAALSANHKLIVGIRPEKIKLEKYDPSKEYSNCFVVNPTVCELLGATYNVYFSCCGKNMIGQISAEEKITVNDKVVVSFSKENMYVFDPITGKRIL